MVVVVRRRPLSGGTIRGRRRGRRRIQRSAAVEHGVPGREATARGGERGSRCAMRAARALLPALFLVAAATARGETDASFRLSAGLEDLPGYFPAYLANGYISTLSAPRGTEATRAYVVALMDYAAGDISRPAAVPGWTEIDFSSNAAGAGQAWLNKAPLNERHF